MRNIDPEGGRPDRPDGSLAARDKRLLRHESNSFILAPLVLSRR